ncbi:PEP-CTERM sorting domain-containing protein [Rugamonas fusca]|uniref:PEP-CTERM sorting domain-containing protein n=1 Tax=Rugamonas fusca TaxID=2758568 RepID=UPI001E4EF619|nr:PEP-CTERM sorting domain-containing protein [Rugamonas fusca]
MNNIKTKAVKLAMAAAGLVLATSAYAAPPASNWVDVTSLVNISNNLGSFSLGGNHTVTFTDFSASPVSVAYYGANLGANSVSDILASLPNSGILGLTKTSSFTAGAAANANPTFTLHPADNSYLAVHFGGAEMLFHWSTAPANFVLTSDKLSNYRAFISPVPEPETYGMLLAGLGLVGFLARRRKAA